MTFLTLGAIYFLAAQAFGFAAGGHVAGRLIGPAIESTQEEEFRAGAHGLVVWSLAVVATALLVAASALVAGSAASQGTVMSSLAAGSTANPSGATIATDYWVDELFRAPPNGQQTSLAWHQYAQADTGNATDAAPPPAQPQGVAGNKGAAPDDEAPTQSMSRSAPDTSATENNPPNDVMVPTPPVVTPPAPQLPDTRNVANDKAEAGRILNIDMKDGGLLTSDDRDQLARLVAQDTGWTLPAAQHRVNDVEARIHDSQVKAADAARKIASYVALWTAFALLFGAVVATAAAISARWEDDRQSLLPMWRTSAPR